MQLRVNKPECGVREDEQVRKDGKIKSEGHVCCEHRGTICSCDNTLLMCYVMLYCVRCLYDTIHLHAMNSNQKLVDYFVICGLNISSGLEPDQLSGYSYLILLILISSILLIKMKVIITMMILLESL